MLLLFSPFGGNRHKAGTIYRISMIALLAIVLIIGTLLFSLKDIGHAAPTNTLLPFPRTVPSLVAHSKPTRGLDRTSSISLSFGLRLRNSDALKGYLQDISRPKSINYHRYLTSAQFIGVFSPTTTTYNAVLQYLQNSGFTITHTYKHRMLITFKGSITSVEQVFHVTINTYTAPNGQVFYSNTADPLVPSSLLGALQSIDGLNNVVHWQHASPSAHHPSPLTKAKSSPNVTCLGHASGYFTPDQITAGYNLNGLYNQGYHGEGQTIALFELATFQMGDLTAYESCYGHSHTSIQTIVTGRDPVPTDGGVLQVESDAELILSAAPQLGILKIYEAGTLNGAVDYNAEWAQIIQDAPPIVSTSWGLCENDMLQLNPNELDQENTYFMTAAAQGQSIFSASDNGGSSGCYFDGKSPDTTLNAGDPAAQPFVTGVGGTRLTLNSNNSYNSETVWNNSHGASGGGISQKWVLPSWQSAPGVSNAYSTGAACNAPARQICREVPDVSLHADPSTGYPIYCTATAANCTLSNPWQIVGGTSMAAPLWAAMMALTNELGVKNAIFNLGFVSPLLYQLASLSNYSNDFHDVTTSNNDYNNLHGGKYPATPAYDLATGLGSYNATNLATDMVTTTLNNASRTSPANINWFFAEGSVGGSFQEYLTLQNPDPVNTTDLTITYLLQTSPPSTKKANKTVSPNSRMTVNVNTDLGVPTTGSQISVATIIHVTSGPPIVAERPMYFNAFSIQSGTDVIGAPDPGTSFYFSEADTRQSGQTQYHTYITLLNPNSKLSDKVTITYYTGGCGGAGQPGCPTETKIVGPLQRQTAAPTDLGLHQKLAIAVTSDNPVVVERPLYFTDTIANAGGLTTGATSQIGATAPGTDWLFAEGYTGTNFQEYFELANFSASPAHATIKLEYTDGSTQAFAVSVPAFGQVPFDVNANYNRTKSTSISAEITSDNPIVADRLMYFHQGSSHFSGGSDVIGTPVAFNAYSFAEGYTAGAFSEFLTLQNPTSTNEVVAVTYFVNGLVFQQQLPVRAHSRLTINVNTAINPISAGAVSMTVQAMGDPTLALIVAERPMYFGYGADQGGTDVIGYTSV